MRGNVEHKPNIRVSIPEGIEGLSGSSAATATSWWNGLPAQVQEELSISWSVEAESCSYARDEGEWKSLPVLVGAEFFPQEDEPEEGADWNQDFYEYLINNPELAIHYRGRIYHICRSHPAAREVLKAGRIPADFACGWKRTDCPMKTVLGLNPGHGIRFFRRGEWVDDGHVLNKGVAPVT